MPSDQSTSDNTTATIQNTAQATSQPTQVPTPTQPAATPTPTHTPKWTTVQTFNGSGNKKTAIFNTSNDWKIIWSCNPASAYLGEYNLTVDVVNSDGTPLDYGAINEICKAGNTTNSTEEHQGGQVYLDIQSDGGTWTIQVQELK